MKKSLLLVLLLFVVVGAVLLVVNKGPSTANKVSLTPVPKMTDSPPVQPLKFHSEKPAEKTVTSEKNIPTPAEPAQAQPLESAQEPAQPKPDKPTDKQFLLCEHIISSVTQYGFTGEIRLINKGNHPVNGWSVTWEYPDGSAIIDADDVALSGNNPYTGEYLSWNAEIAPGQTVTFKFSGVKGGENAPLGVKVTGESCMN
ncbi:cellulose binding domain-containing protein [Teredinibacter turnerae]|uniref:cellulose binding domain-containing protein n=1 Tax=Teredinibacter turnerae TaxID=2426 RepID=UPI0003791E47|nr:cellulose binding domain-containing protein [Teredinibacter turnerae]